MREAERVKRKTSGPLPEAERIRRVRNGRISAAFFWLTMLGGGYLVYAVLDAVQQERTQADRVARAVSELPPDTERLWIEYVHRRIAATMTRQGNAVEVIAMDSFVTHAISIVSINTPYTVSCDNGLGVTIEFGYGDDSITVPIFGPMVLNRAAEKRPQLGVHRSSIAATKLNETLCHIVSQSVQAIMAPN